MISRRKALERIMATGAGVTAAGYVLPGARAGDRAGSGESKIAPPQDALARLREGNVRYLEMKRSPRPDVGPDARRSLTKGQWPYATILCCSDSRVPPELIFDEGLGRLFIVRVAGNILTPALLGSIEYASLHSTSRLVVVLGHESCGAVGAAVHAAANPGTQETPAIKTIIDGLMPAVVKARKSTGLDGKQTSRGGSQGERADDRPPNRRPKRAARQDAKRRQAPDSRRLLLACHGQGRHLGVRPSPAER